MTTLRIAAVLLIIAAAGCGKKEESGAGGAASKSGLAWTPEGYDKMTPTCKKALACCEEVAKTEGAKSAEDFNGKCSGPAMWKDGECDLDTKMRVQSFQEKSQPVPDACK